MRHKKIVSILIVLLFFTLPPVTGFADPPYNSDEVGKLRTFLNLMSADGTNTNGYRLNSAYDPNDPSTWGGVTWTYVAAQMHVSEIAFSGKNLAGSLDLSNFMALQIVICSTNQLTSINVSGCSVLGRLQCNANLLTALNMSGCSALSNLNCGGNRLTSLNITDSPSLNSINTSGNSLTQILAMIGVNSVTLTASGDGNVALYKSSGYLSANANPIDRFINWTQAGAPYSNTPITVLSLSASYNLTAHFPLPLVTADPPQTGDSFSLAAWIAIEILMALAICMLLLNRRRRRA